MTAERYALYVFDIEVDDFKALGMVIGHATANAIKANSPSSVFPGDTRRVTALIPEPWDEDIRRHLAEIGIQA